MLKSVTVVALLWCGIYYDLHIENREETKMILTVVLGVIGAIIANFNGLDASMVGWWLTCFPWWTIAAVINFNRGI